LTTNLAASRAPVPANLSSGPAPNRRRTADRL